ncbi:MAG: DegT/DnrJ/EryC1/StrS family aminotransferase, partial [Flavobacteriales bacterium]
IVFFIPHTQPFLKGTNSNQKAYLCRKNTYFSAMERIPFSPPRTDQKTVDAVTEVLLSGWITTGPKTKLFEKNIEAYLNSKRVICLNSWTNACELMLRAFDVGEGDEVILPAYTYAATANIVCHVGATPVLADVNPRTFHLEPEELLSKISQRTKAVMPVDIGGLPVDYNAIEKVIAQANFKANSEMQEALGRPLFLSDAAHSFGATYKQEKVGKQADVTGYSFHAVKNLTTAEGGALALNMPEPFLNDELYKQLNIKSLHGQTKDALAKTQGGSWRYDIIEPGYKCNMTDLQAAIGLVELERYDETLARRKFISESYHKGFSDQNWYLAPVLKDDSRETSYHLFMLSIDNCTEEKRDLIMAELAEKGISTNVHFQPIPMLSYYKGMGYKMSDYPNSFTSYSREISLPVYFDLTDNQVDRIISEVIKTVNKLL